MVCDVLSIAIVLKLKRLFLRNSRKILCVFVLILLEIEIEAFLVGGARVDDMRAVLMS